LTIKELPKYERPYEKMEMYGAKQLTTAELLAIIIKNGTKEETSVQIAQKILAMQGEKQEGLRFLQDISIEEFQKIKGIGTVKAIQLKAVCELATRMARPIQKEIKITTTKEAAGLMLEELKYEKNEIIKVLLLNTKNVLQKIVEVGKGGTNKVMVEPKDILAEAIKIGAPKIIMLHNHPSGDPTPSKADYHISERVYMAAQIMGIELLDHIVIGDGRFQSAFCKERIVENENK